MRAEQSPSITRMILQDQLCRSSLSNRRPARRLPSSVILGPPFIPNLQPQTFVPRIVPQTKNGRNRQQLPINSKNRPLMRPKTMGFDLFLEKAFLNFFYSKIPAPVSGPSSSPSNLPGCLNSPGCQRLELSITLGVSNREDCLVHGRHSSAPNVQTCQRSNVPTQSFHPSIHHN
jgi:hypothetical protein